MGIIDYKPKCEKCVFYLGYLPRIVGRVKLSSEMYHFCIIDECPKYKCEGEYKPTGNKTYLIDE